MTFKNFIKGIIFLIPFLFSSCNDERQLPHEAKCKIICSVDKFESTNTSRTNTDPENNFLITWTSGDVIGIFPREGYQEPFEIPANQFGNTSASFDGGYWDVKEGYYYNAYYPFDKKNFDSAEMKTKIPISYVGQKQNGTSCNIGAFDYTYSDWKAATGGTISFDFHHIGAIAVFSLEYPATTTYTQFTISVDKALIPLQGTYDLTADDVTLIPDENHFSTSISLELTNCSGVAGETGVFYMMLPTMDLSNSEVTLTLTSEAGTTCTYSIEKALNVKKGKLYRRTGIPEESSVEGTIDGWDDEEGIGDVEENKIPYVTFTADAAQTFSMSQAVETLEYSVNGGEWTTLGTSVVDFGGELGELRLRGKSSIGTNRETVLLGNSTLVACSGDIRTLVDYENYNTADTQKAIYFNLFKGCTPLVSAPELPATILAEDCYANMFYGCTNLVNAPKLPATTLSTSCYAMMFYGCTNLTNAPELPATTLTQACYRYMFNGCTSLTNAPELPATTMTAYCYSNMFNGCTNLVNAPQLPATILADNCYNGMFSKCSSLTNAPKLPAKTLAQNCYYAMFSGCSNLTNVPELPATTLVKECYASMFMKCSSLTTAPELPATILAESCYDAMFWKCSSLTTAPELPATILAESCYNGMFRDCSSLANAPELPATILAELCYYGMFRGCSSLTNAPELPAATLAKQCYYSMFYDCKKIDSILMLATDVSAQDCLYNWLYGVSSTGTFTKAASMNDLPEGTSGIPNGWTVKNYGETIDNTPYLTFTANSAQTLTMSQAVETLEYSVNGGEWMELGTSIVEFGGELGKLQLRGKSMSGTASSNSDYSYIIFGNNVPVKCSGDIRTLIDYDNYDTVNTGEARFCYLFTNCSTLTTAPELPAKTLADKCYYSMFRACSNLIAAPELPATTLSDECYNFMFVDCTILKNAPNLPATILAKDCYSSMFQGCTSLTAVPELPATTLAYGCYRWMFATCTSLEIAPELPAKSLANNCYESMFAECESLITTPKLSATTLADNCYENMFYNCSNLTTSTELPATTLTNDCYSGMFMYCANLKESPKLPATELAQRCYSNMFYGCTSLTTAPELPATTLAVNCYFGMFQNCTNLTTAPNLPATTLAAGCYFGMFQYCTSLTTAPELPATTLTEMCYHTMFYGCSSLKSTPKLPATTLADYCYWRMFYECSQLTNVTMLATDASASSCLTSWLYGVSSTGTFTKAASMNNLPEGTSGIPSGWTIINYEEE